MRYETSVAIVACTFAVVPPVRAKSSCSVFDAVVSCSPPGNWRWLWYLNVLAMFSGENTLNVKSIEYPSELAYPVPTCCKSLFNVSFKESTSTKPQAWKLQ